MAVFFRSYIEEVVEIEKSRNENGPVSTLKIVDDLQTRLDGDPELNDHFIALTPVRQREYSIYYSGAKQYSTRVGHVERYDSKIHNGKRFRDR